MVRTHDDPLDRAVPETDRLEQEQQAGPEGGHDLGWPDPATPEADEADRLEQAHEVLADPDEEYAPDTPAE
ncbi:MAG TPA: hypothetical protein VLA55_10750 [Ornithinibacter sp.]|nr:hypothetical protein [Ornithinibacter sp.]